MARTRVVIDPAATPLLQAMADDFVETTVLPKIVKHAQRVVPVDSGDLRRSIHAEVNSAGLFVVADEEYAAEVELGTSKMAAQPFLRPALLNSVAR